MTEDRPTRRDLMKPAQLLGLAFGAALFAGIVTLVSMGVFQQQSADETRSAIVVALIIAGVSFVAVLLVTALLLLAVDPAQIAKTVDRPVLLPDADAADAGGSAGDADAPGESGSESPRG